MFKGKLGIIGVLLVALLFVSATTIVTVASDDLGMSLKLITLLTEVKTTMEEFQTDQLSLSEVTEDFLYHKAKAQKLYEQALKNDTSPQLTKVLAGYSLTIDLFYSGFNDRNVEKIKAANKMLKYSLVPQTEKLNSN